VNAPQRPRRNGTADSVGQRTVGRRSLVTRVGHAGATVPNDRQDSRPSCSTATSGLRRRLIAARRIEARRGVARGQGRLPAKAALELRPARPCPTSEAIFAPGWTSGRPDLGSHAASGGFAPPAPEFIDFATSL